MEQKEVASNEAYTIDVLHILRTLWSRAWVILLCSLLTAALGFAYATYGIKPTYSSYVKLYVNNSSFTLGGHNFSISSSDLSAAQSLLKIYGEVLDSRSTLERIIEETGVKYTWQELSGKISYTSSNGTEIMKVTVTSEDPYEASKIANTIAEVLPIRIEEIIDFTSMKVVDSAIPNLNKIAPSITKYTATGLAIGFLLSAAVFVVVALMDDTIHDEEYFHQHYSYPVLGRVPDLLGGGKSYSYYYSYHSKKN